MKSLRTIWATALSRLIVLAALTGVAAFTFIYLFIAGSRSEVVSAAECSEGVACVYLQTDRAIPDVTTVEVGKYVQFNSADGKTHSLGIGAGDAHSNGSHDHQGSFVSGDFGADEAWKVQFKKTGTYELHDHYRPDIRVTVIVYDPARQSAIK